MVVNINFYDIVEGVEIVLEVKKVGCQKMNRSMEGTEFTRQVCDTFGEFV